MLRPTALNCTVLISRSLGVIPTAGVFIAAFLDEYPLATNDDENRESPIIKHFFRRGSASGQEAGCWRDWRTLRQSAVRWSMLLPAMLLQSGSTSSCSYMDTCLLLTRISPANTIHCKQIRGSCCTYIARITIRICVINRNSWKKITRSRKFSIVRRLKLL